MLCFYNLVQILNCSVTIAQFMLILRMLLLARPMFSYKVESLFLHDLGIAWPRISGCGFCIVRVFAIVTLISYQELFHSHQLCEHQEHGQKPGHIFSTWYRTVILQGVRALYVGLAYWRNAYKIICFDTPMPEFIK